jgi:endoglucanase
MKFKLLASLIFLCLAVEAQQNIIRINQEGYYPEAPKIAILIISPGSFIDSAEKGIPFFLTGENGADTVFRGVLSGIRLSANSSLQTRVADFSSFSHTGTYQLRIREYASYPFQIKAKVHRPVALASLKAFYYIRASTSLDPVYAGKWSRAEGHPDDSVIIHPSAASENRSAGSLISTPGGWYDAGDYNKYIVNSGITMGTLLSAYEDFKPYFDTLHTHIPSLRKPIPDILNEIVYNLRWMLSMQDPGDGGVYNKCTNAKFDTMEMPAEGRAPRYVVQKGTAATLDFAAVTAQSARIFSRYKKELPGLADSCVLASKRAWNWAVSHPNLVYNQNMMNQQFEPKITTGGYGDWKFSDEWFWAACELFITTGDKNYRDSLLAHRNLKLTLPSWSETGLLGYYTVLRDNGKHHLPMKEDSGYMRLKKMADDYVLASAGNAFLTVMGGRKSDFIWGSNANAANQAILLIQVYRVSHDRKYLDAALGNLDYLLGRNATGYSFVTGYGSFSTRHPHHRPSVADGIDDPIPGLLAGGPNPGMQDRTHYDFHEPETAYADADPAFASNEIAINWNAPLVYLANALEALY